MTSDARFPDERVGPAEIARTLAEVRKRPPPTNPSAFGWTIAMSAAVALLLTIFVARFTGLSSGTLLFIRIALGAAVIVGGLVGILGGAFARGSVARDAEAAIQELIAAYPNGDSAVLRGAAVRILDQSVVSTGPASVEAFDREEVAERLGDALAYVIAVEEVLLRQEQIYPCFTLCDTPQYDDDDLEDWV